jgi:hypothetical protein
MHKERHEIVQNSVRIFPDQPSLVHPDRIESSQQNNGPCVVRLGNIRQDLLEKQFSASVWVRRGERIGRFAWRLRVPAGRSRGGTENDFFALHLVISLRGLNVSVRLLRQKVIEISTDSFGFGNQSDRVRDEIRPTVRSKNGFPVVQPLRWRDSESSVMNLALQPGTLAKTLAIVKMP